MARENHANKKRKKTVFENQIWLEDGPLSSEMAMEWLWIAKKGGVPGSQNELNL